MPREIAHAFRSLTRRPTFALVATGLLALGIGLTTTAFGVVDGLLLQPPPFDAPQRILVLSGANPAHGLTNAALSYPAMVDLMSSNHSLKLVALVRSDRTIVV